MWAKNFKENWFDTSHAGFTCQRGFQMQPLQEKIHSIQIPFMAQGELSQIQRFPLSYLSQNVPPSLPLDQTPKIIPFQRDTVYVLQRKFWIPQKFAKSWRTVSQG